MRGPNFVRATAVSTYNLHGSVLHEAVDIVSLVLVLWLLPLGMQSPAVL